MGLFDKIKDNAKTISMKAIESTKEYDEEYLESQAAGSDDSGSTAAVIDEPKIIDEETTDKASGNPEINSVESESNEEPQFEDIEPKQTKNESKTEDREAQTEKDQTKNENTEKPARTSKITEIPKDKYEKAQKPYTPHYKSGSNKEPEADDAKVEVKKEEPKPKTEKKKTAAKKKSTHIIDIAPKKPEDNVKKAIYARERATMAALSTQRRLNGTVPLYSTAYMNFKTRVFIDRVEYSGSFGRTVLPISQVAWVKLRHGGTGVIIETTESKRVVLVVKPDDRLSFADAVIKVQGMKPKKGNKVDDKTVRIDQLEKFGDGVDEIEKLAKLYDKGIITEDEFEAKKKQILGI